MVRNLGRRSIRRKEYYIGTTVFVACELILRAKLHYTNVDANMFASIQTVTAVQMVKIEMNSWLPPDGTRLPSLSFTAHCNCNCNINGRDANNSTTCRQQFHHQRTKLGVWTIRTSGYAYPGLFVPWVD